MKLITTLITLIIVKTTLGQKQNLYQIWIGDSLEYLSLDSTHATFHFSGKYGYHDKKGYHLVGDTLRLQDWFHSSADNYKTLQHKDYDFLVKVHKNTFFLNPINKDALLLAGNRSKIRFEPIANIYKEKFDFDSLKFTSTICYGKCPEMTLIIKGKKLFFKGGAYAVKHGNYEAVLADSLYFQLREHLRKSAIDRIVNWKQEVVDAPYYTLTVYYDKKEVFIEGYFLPLVTKDLLKFLLSLPKKIENDLQ